ncbi:hypothetical protein OGL96_11845 [Lacticaseibacillus paracasei]|uniref:hypothetical protein n=1 Tax=Lacticaseibacillus paracasei TaxID=1597 RepID=UPI0021E7CADA|nr:hypothetical protein [Lacticaseibacillus paracasei]UYI59517.1 hypothetical protein OGL96_11845 [Lacticaseibacillus paracasei]
MPKLSFYLPMIEDDEEGVFETWPNGQRTYDKLSEGLHSYIQEIAVKSQTTSQIERDRYGNQRLAFYANGCETQAKRFETEAAAKEFAKWLNPICEVVPLEEGDDHD